MASQLKFADSHNLVGYLLDPPAAHSEFKSMVAGLNNCRISHALRSNPVIRKDLINELWENATAEETEEIKSTVKGKQIMINEQIIREVLQFGDQSEFPTECPADQIDKVLVRMSYEGSFPPTIKKLLPPYWRFLAHTFVSCISGRKGGSDEISQSATSAIVALTIDWDFNFSRFVFEEMKKNLSAKRKDMFLMYPRFLQMILDAKHPELERTPDTLDVKSLGPNTFGLMKQVRKSSKVVYKGTNPLVKFGKFAERVDASAAHIPNAIVAEEHVVPPEPQPVPVIEVPDNDKEGQETSGNTNDVSAGDTEEILDDAGDANNDGYGTVVIPKDDGSTKIVNEAVISTAETEDDISKQKSDEPTPIQIDAPIIQAQSSAQDPPPTMTVANEDLSVGDKEEARVSLVSRKRKRKDLGVLIIEQIPKQTQETIQAMQFNEQEFFPDWSEMRKEPYENLETFVSGSSSGQFHQGGNSSAPPPPKHDATSVQLAKLIAFNDSYSQHTRINIESERAKGKKSQSDPPNVIQEVAYLRQKLIEKELHIGNLDVRVSDLEKDNSKKDVQISELQANLCCLLALYFDLKDKLNKKFGDEFNTSEAPVQGSQDAPARATTSSAPARDAISRAPEVSIDEYLTSSAPVNAKERGNNTGEDGALRGFEFWAYDELSSSVLIKAGELQYRIIDPKDLLKFGEEDIKLLAQNQLAVTSEHFEHLSKPFIKMVVDIVKNKLWAGALAGSDMHLLDLP